MSAQAHTSDPATLDRRTLARDHRRLAALLRPGMHVLDIGCGTGAITVGIAQAVAPGGSVVGLDRDATLLDRARAQHAAVSGLRFVEGDVLALDGPDRFDVVTAARALQWIDHPDDALARMATATRPGGWVVVLDYSHADLTWEPEPPPAIRRFIDCFLAWRTAHGWDNRIAHRLAAMFTSAGLIEVSTSVEDEIACLGDAGFEDALAIWQQVIRTMASPMIETGAIDADGADAAAAAWEDWRRVAHRQHMVMRAVVGRRPDGGHR